MSADDFKAQATTQSIGATSIPSEESFGTATLADNRSVILSSGIISNNQFTTNSSMSVVNNLNVTSGIASSENILNNNSFGQNNYFIIPSISKALRDLDLISPTITSSIGITLSPISTSESFPSASIGNMSYISFSANGIISAEVLGNHTLNTITYITQESPISSEEFLYSTTLFSLNNNIYPSGIATSEAFENDNYFGNISGIILTQGITTEFNSPINSTISLLGSVQNITQSTGIASSLAFGRRNTFLPPPPSFLRKGFIYGYTVLVNNILVTLERENLLDTITKVPRKIENLQTRAESINGFIESKNSISSNIDVVYSIEGEIVQEQSVIARQSKYYLESYIKPKHKISSTIYVEQNTNFYKRRNGTIN